MNKIKVIYGSVIEHDIIIETEKSVSEIYSNGRRNMFIFVSSDMIIPFEQVISIEKI